MPETARYWALWGKTKRGEAAGDETHALIHHMVEVGAVARELWRGIASEATRGDLCGATGLRDGEMGTLLAWLASLHDLGKACPAFQAKYRAAIPALEAAGLPVPTQGARATHHTAVGHAVLLEELPRLADVPPRVLRGLAAILGGHHGVWQRTPPEIPYWELGDNNWTAARHELASALTALFAPPLAQRWPGGWADLNAFLALLAGLVTMADWLGSMAEFFACRSGPSELPAYLDYARERARAALAATLPGRLPDDEQAPSFERLFPTYTPNEVQAAAIALSEQLREPALLIIEAPTGSGKTEAALYVAEWLRARQGGPGSYVAMPTMTTSNQMHDRVSAALEAAHPGLPLRPLLVHGQALFRAPAATVAGAEDDDARAPDPMAWFLPRKRSLLAPYGVGTVDQALMSVLPATHFYLRLYGLARKTVVFDEVHAYDTYMSTLFERLLGWLYTLGSSVVILSATLPAATRQRLLAAFGPAGAMLEPAPGAYPAISWRSGSETGAIPLPATGYSREVGLRRLAPAGVVDDLRDNLADGGCAAVICNTVGRAQAVYLALKDAAVVPEESLYLFHARFPQAWRDGIEKQVLARFGKGRRRQPGEQAIVVATQVIEQSLDLDFDYMLSDLAPVDLLIQRAGRLHRHKRPAVERPPGLREATLAIMDAADGDLPDLDHAPVYEPYVLWRTWLALEGRETLRTPEETGALIEAVYGGVEPDVSARPAVAAALRRARAKQDEHVRTAVEEAKRRLVPAPESRYFVGGQAEVLHDDDPEVHRSLQALTRLAEPSVQVVCLHRHGDRLSANPGGGPFLAVEQLDHENARALARSSVSVTHRGAVFALLGEEPPAAWARHPFLRYCRLAVFEDGRCRLAGSGYTLRLTRELGLEVIKEEA